MDSAACCCPPAVSLRIPQLLSQDNSLRAPHLAPKSNKRRAAIVPGGFAACCESFAALEDRKVAAGPPARARSALGCECRPSAQPACSLVRAEGQARHSS